MGKTPRDIGASVRARLMNLARERGQVFDLLLTRYALEGLLYRLSISEHRNRCVLKERYWSPDGPLIRTAQPGPGTAGFRKCASALAAENNQMAIDFGG